jgi:hypothetical protein
MRSVGSFSFAWSSHSLTEAAAAFGGARASTSPNLPSTNLRQAARFAAQSPRLARASLVSQTDTQASDGPLRASRTEVSRMGLKRFASRARVSAKRAAVILCGCALPLLTTACASNQQERFGWQFGSTSFEPVGSTAPNTEAASEAYEAPASVSGNASTEPSSEPWRTYVYPAAMFAYRGDSR